MAPAENETGLSGEKPAASPEERDKLVFQQMYYLKTLYELTAELSPITSSQKLLESFLLMAMGVNGSGQAMMMICDRQNQRVLSASRGTRFERDWTVESAEKHLYRGFQTAENRRLAPMSVTFIGDPQQVFSELETGLDVHSALLFMVDDSLLGIVGLGAPIDGRDFTLEEKDILSGMTASFMVFLKNVRAYETVQALNADLSRTNDALRQTIVELTEARQQIRLLEVAGIRLKQLFQQKIEQAGALSDHRCAAGSCRCIAAVAAVQFFQPERHSTLAGRGVPGAGASGGCPGCSASAQCRAIPFWWMPDLRSFSAVVTFPMPSIFRRTLFDIIYPMKLASRLQPGQPVVVYGRTFSKRYDEEVAYRLLQRHDDVRVMTGGMAEWEKQGRAP